MDNYSEAIYSFIYLIIIDFFSKKYSPISKSETGNISNEVSVQVCFFFFSILAIELF